MPTPLEKSPEPEFGTGLIPKDRYVSPEFMRREWDGMWRRVWLLAGRAADVARPGDYFTFEIGPESVIVARDRAGRVGAHYNVCLHRGNRLCDPGRGHVATFGCRYHGWEWNLDGTLHCAVDAATFRPAVPPDLRLGPVRCETFAGFVWICLDPAAAPLAEFLGVLPAHLGPYRFEDHALTVDATVEVACNWKTSVDAFNEAYHVHATHPQLLEFTDDVNVQIDFYDRHSRFIFKVAVPSPRLGKRPGIPAPIRDLVLPGCGVDPATFTGTIDDVRPAIFAGIRRQCAEAGIDVAALHDEQLIDDLHYTIFPNVTLNIHGRGFWLFRHRPHPDDPNRMLFDFQDYALLAPGTAPARPEHVTGEIAGTSLGDVIDQDLANLPRVQAGMRSAAFTGLRLSEQERRIRHFHRVLESYVSA
jgi:phenylpropionate dioxygenase-like ring-hydroxylating dioxygenase large terminal subunit